MAKVLLLSSVFDEVASSGKSASMSAVINLIPPLGLAYIGAVLEHAGHYVKIIDGSLSSLKKIEKAVAAFSPDIVGLTSTTPEFEGCMRIARAVRKLSSAKIIIGGTHVTALPEMTMRTGLFDIGVLGEGEHTVLELANNPGIFLGDKSALSKIRGIAYIQGKKLKITKPRPLIQNLDELPFPARHLLPPLKNYKPTPASYRKLPQAHVMTSRGCPGTCTFCDNAIFGRTYRERSVQNIMQEIDLLVAEYGVREIKFFDDNFTLNRKKLYDICRQMKKRNLGWCCLTRVNLVTKDMLIHMKKSGCWQVLYGLESGDPQMLKRLGKGTTVQQNIRAVRWAHKAGLSVRADFIVGTPGETRKSIRKTLNFAKKLNMDFAHFNKFTPYPGTTLYEQLLVKGYKFDFSKACSQLDHSIVLYHPDTIPAKDFSTTIDRAHKEYYLRPSYIMRQIFNIRSLTDIDRLWRGFKAIAFL